MTHSPTNQWQHLSKYQGTTAQDYQQYLAAMKESIAQRMASFEQQAAKAEETIAQLERKAQKSRQKPVQETVTTMQIPPAQVTAQQQSSRDTTSWSRSIDNPAPVPEGQNRRAASPERITAYESVAGPVRSVLRTSG